MAEALCSTDYTSGSMIVMKNLGVLKHLKLMSLHLTDPNKRKHPRTLHRNFEDVVLVSLLLTLNIFYTFF